MTVYGVFVDFGNGKHLCILYQDEERAKHHCEDMNNELDNLYFVEAWEVH